MERSRRSRSRRAWRKVGAARWNRVLEDEDVDERRRFRMEERVEEKEVEKRRRSRVKREVEKRRRSRGEDEDVEERRRRTVLGPLS